MEMVLVKNFKEVMYHQDKYRGEIATEKTTCSVQLRKKTI